MWFGFSIPTVILSPQSLTGSWRLPLVACQLARVCRGLWLSRSSSREAVVTYRPPITPLTGYKHARSPPPLPPLRLCWGLVLYGHSDQQPTGHDVGATQIVEEKANWILSSENIGAEPGCRRWTGQGPGGCRNKTNLCHYPRFHRLMEVAPHRLSITPPKSSWNCRHWSPLTIYTSITITEVTSVQDRTNQCERNWIYEPERLYVLKSSYRVCLLKGSSPQNGWRKIIPDLRSDPTIGHLLVKYLLFSQKNFELVRPSLIWPISED